MKALIINGHIKWPQIAEGNLNGTIFKKSKQAFNEKGYEILETVIDNGYEIPQEIEKWVNADVILFHFPINWFGMPAKTKDYIDKVLMSGYGKIYAGDGRNSGGNYGTGGLLKSKGIIVNTWNAPEETFGNEGQLLESFSMEEFTRPFTATLQFVGIQPLPTFAFYDVFKNPNIEQELVSFEEHLKNHI
ncbi:NAD(P)H-dependent oxidoreductase [Chryseobacterium sp.]|uniref:NAD(P)H-dependent oxidoreductase n=1 Tax=Chryseobacterium sp. TaxID=1871047 RepID=UPI0025C1B284|nr:NAD(P)H-dependent oxidoreductase [Chryseobacterium sp.]